MTTIERGIDIVRRCGLNPDDFSFSYVPVGRSESAICTFAMSVLDRRWGQSLYPLSSLSHGPEPAEDFEELFEKDLLRRYPKKPKPE